MVDFTFKNQKNIKEDILNIALYDATHFFFSFECFMRQNQSGSKTHLPGYLRLGRMDCNTLIQSDVCRSQGRTFLLCAAGAD